MVMLGSIATSIIGYATSDYNQWTGDPSKAKTITVYSNSGAVLKTYRSAGVVGVGRDGCHFYDSANGNRVKIQGSFIVE